MGEVCLVVKKRALLEYCYRKYANRIEDILKVLSEKKKI